MVENITWTDNDYGDRFTEKVIEALNSLNTRVNALEEAMREQ